MVLLDKLEEYYCYLTQRKSGWFILTCVIVFVCVGMVILSSASLSFIKSEDYFLRQLLWSGIGVPFFLLGCLTELDFLKRHSNLFLSIFACLLVLVLIPGIGKLVNGSRRWIVVGGMNIQVSEFAKIAILIWMAKYLEKNRDQIHEFRNGFFIPLAIPGAVCCLILLEPDYGTTILMCAVVVTLLFLAGARLLYLFIAMLIGLSCLSILIILTPTRMRRIVAFLDVEKNKLGGAYQLWQSILGFASGGLFGRGIGQGRQQLVYLPEAHTDFIFPILSEELGGLVAMMILVIYLLFFITVSHCAKRLKNDFAKFLSYGIALMITYQVVINVGVVTGLLPTKGMVLPFISYGGSNLILLFFMIGLLLNCFSSATRDCE